MPVSRPAPATRRIRLAAAGILALRILLAAIFLYEGIDKLSASRLWTTIFARIGFGQWFRDAAGTIEIVGALLLLTRRTAAVGVLLLACTMIGALLTHAFAIGVGPQTAVVVLLLGFLLLLARSTSTRSGFSHRSFDPWSARRNRA